MNENEDFSGRLQFLSVVIVLIIAVLIGRAGYLQVYDGELYARLAEGNRIRIIPAEAARGTFYDRNGELLVTNRPGFAVSLLPLTEPVSPEVIARVSKLIHVPIAEIQQKIDTHVGFDPIRIKTDVLPDIVTLIEEQKDDYPGVVIEVLPIRDYIYGEYAAHVFGYVSEINEEELERRKNEGYKSGYIIGKFGLERIYDKEVRGVNGGDQVEVDVSGRPVQLLGRQSPVPGNDLVLTIDKHLQEAAEQAVDAQLAIVHANAAAAVVMNPQTGEVLAMVSRPAFNPNLFAGGISTVNWNMLNNNPYHPMDNKAITGEYPPGSTFKIVTGTAALAEHKVTAQEKIFDSGRHWIIPKTNAGGEALGWIDFEQAMAHSDNVYFYEMGNRLGVDTLERYARLFGLGTRTGIDLPYEAEGLVPNRKYKADNYEDGEWYLSETFDAAIGQGFNLVTPLQAAMVVSEIAANGQRYRPHLVQRIVDVNGNTVREIKPELLSTLEVDPSVIHHVQEGLHSVTKLGTGTALFAGFPVDIAGKTGTAENSQGRDHSWFVAYGPYKNPNVVVAVIVEQGGFGSVAAGPIARRILEAAFGLDKQIESMQGKSEGSQ